MKRIAQDVVINNKPKPCEHWWSSFKKCENHLDVQGASICYAVEGGCRDRLWRFCFCCNEVQIKGYELALLLEEYDALRE